MTAATNHVLKPQPQDPLLPDAPLPLADLCARLDDRITTFLRDDSLADARLRAVQDQTRTALGVIEEALQRYSSLDELSLSYNGGKDCLVLLVLYLCALHRRSTSTATPLPKTVETVYIQSSHPFPEVESFVAESSDAYNLTLKTYNAPMKAAFELYLRDQPSVKAIFVGTRRTDPHGEHLTHFDPTDHGWPSFMRIHPFIRYLGIPYCQLYDQGYTSLGGTTDTHPNPALRIPSTEVDEDRKDGKFRPAYELVEDYEERLGRDKGTNSRKAAPQPSP
ncbi:3'-phosphoadenosine 5'-phosphosulfate sulfotransferase [Neofusicoccum ribis]|uniref:FAD synthase n=1 Tax=Neofusicoccum ribis TaxID=45134 RepID=A0ABR3SDZ9_9PEZI